MPDEQYRKEQQERRREADAAFVERFRAQREAFEELQQQRRKEEQQEQEARLSVGKPLWQLEVNRDYEVGPTKALEFRAEKPWLKRFGTHHLEEAALIRERYPTLSKWMGLGKSAAVAEKIPGGKKLHRKLEMLPDRLKNAVKQAKEQTKDRLSGPIPLNFHKDSAKLGLKWLTDPESSAEQKKAGWGILTRQLMKVAENLPHEMGRLKSAAKRGYKGYETDIFSKELDIFGVEGRGGTRGLVDEAKRDVELKRMQDQRSPYHEPERFNQLKELQAEQHNRELKDLIERGLAEPDPHKASTEQLDNEREFARKMKELGLAR